MFNLNPSLSRIALVGTSVLLASVMETAQATPKLAHLTNTAEPLNQQARPLLLAETRNYCLENESLFVAAETRGFWVNICGGDFPATYVGVSKRNGNAIRLPLDYYEPDGTLFEAFNGNVSYLLIRGTTKGDFLTVTQGTRELFRQPILRWE